MFRIIIEAFVFQSYNIPSGSMLKNLLVGDYIFVSKFAYGYSILSQSRISYHIKILKEAGLISDRQEGRWVYCSLNKESLFLIKEWITSLTDYSSNRKRCCD